MSSAPDTTEFIAKRQAELAQTQRALESAQREIAAQQQAWEAQVAGYKRRYEDELRRLAHESVAAAASQPPLPAADIEVDKATRLTRLVKRRRGVV